MNPAVSVVLPVYNGGGRVKRTIDGVLAQTFNGFEVVVVDDGSEDDTLEVLESVSDMRVRVLSTYDPVRVRADPNVKAWKLRVLQAVDGWTARRFVDRFHAITDAVKDAAVRDLHIDPAKITLIPRSRNPERLGERSPERRAEVPARLGIPDDALVLLNVGRQEYQKGQRYLLEAAATLREEHPEVVALIAGKEGNATGDLQASHRELALGDSVRFLGHRDDIGDLLAAADVFGFPSIYEGLGGALLEAMAMGLPIVASDLPAIRETLNQVPSVLLVEPSAVDLLVAAIGESAASRRNLLCEVAPPILQFGQVARRMTVWLVEDASMQARPKSGERR